MPFVYKYVNLATKEPEYIGIVKSDDGLDKRITQHQRDDWYKGSLYAIYYTHVETQTDAEALEAHFIALYETYKHHNKAKAKWGLLSFVPEIEWVRYDDSHIHHIKSAKDIERRYCWLRERLWDIYSDIQKLSNEREWLLDRIFETEKEVEKINRASIRKYVNSTYYVGLGNMAISKDELFNQYSEWAEECEDEGVIIFEDSDEFWEVVLDMYDLQNYAYNCRLYPVQDKSIPLR